MNDLISRQAAIDVMLAALDDDWESDYAKDRMCELPSAQPTLYGYSIEPLALIATIMQKEHITPEKALEYFKDIQRMGQMIVDEQQEMIKRATEKWRVKSNDNP